MRLLVAIVVVISLSCTNAAIKNKALKCTANNIKRQKCKHGKASCITRVTGVTYNYNDVTPRGFVVHWNPVPTANCYYVEVLAPRSTVAYKTISCFKSTTFKAGGLRPWQTYGFRVSVVNRRCKKGRPSLPVLKIKTLWDATFKTTVAPRLTFSPKVGKCGRNKFTCHSNPKECIPSKGWCNRILQCEDGSDERFCPGGCKEINVDLKNGNYSCPRFGSPGSFCFFDCNQGYMRDGASHTKCMRGFKQWSEPIPTCRLSFTRIFKVIPEETTDKTVTVVWEPVKKASEYVFHATEKLHINEGDENFTVTKVINATICCTTVLSGLKPRVEYQISMRAIDAEGVPGMESLPVFVVPAKSPIGKS